MEMKKSLDQVLQELYGAVARARENHQPVVVDQLMKKIRRIEKRAKKGVK